MAQAPVYVPVTTTAPAKYNLLDTFPPETAPDGATFGGVHFESDFCGTADVYDAICDETPSTKTVNDGTAYVTGDPFIIYHIFQCRLVGNGSNVEERSKQRALRSLDLGASRAVEEGFQTVFGTGATDISPGTPVDPVRSLGMLEQYAGTVYGGVPVIHMDRLMAIRLYDHGVLERVGDHLETGLGSIVVAGAGYNSDAALPVAAGAGNDWMYATGQVRIWQSPKTVISPIVLDNPYDNQFKSLAERIYVPTYECFHAAIKVTEA